MSQRSDPSLNGQQNMLAICTFRQPGPIHSKKKHQATFFGFFWYRSQWINRDTLEVLSSGDKTSSPLIQLAISPKGRLGLLYWVQFAQSSRANSAHRGLSLSGNCQEIGTDWPMHTYSLPDRKSTAWLAFYSDEIFVSDVRSGAQSMRQVRTQSLFTG